VSVDRVSHSALYAFCKSDISSRFVDWVGTIRGVQTHWHSTQTEESTVITAATVCEISFYQTRVVTSVPGGGMGCKWVHPLKIFAKCQREIC
jgi:hypothetical protein